MANCRTAVLMMFLVGVLWAAGKLEAARPAEGLGRSGASFVVSVDHQSTGGQPYPRAPGMNKKMSTSIVQGRDAITFGLTPDTGSNAFFRTSDASTASTTRPAAGKPVAPNLGKCPSSGQGIEAGGTNKLRGAPSAAGIPHQDLLYKGGLIREHMAGLCHLLPQKPWRDSNCCATLMPNCTAELGPELPLAVRSLSSLSFGPFPPLRASIESLHYSASPKTHHTFRAAATTGASVRGYQGSAATPVSLASRSVLVPGHTEADGQSAMPDSVYQAFQTYRTTAHAALANSTLATLAAQYGFNFWGCPPSGEACSSNVLGSQSPQCINRATSPPSNFSAVANTLLLVYPGCINLEIKSAGGAIANDPALLQVNLCNGGHGLQPAGDTASCSYVQSSGTYLLFLWLDGLWLFGRFVQIDPGGQTKGQSCIAIAYASFRPHSTDMHNNCGTACTTKLAPAGSYVLCRVALHCIDKPGLPRPEV